ncbi:MAG TPA: hypothetical protein PLM53_06395 [Spirochaetota bacterium]|nr:hypothetical protein [Spirochaetota bacterium]HPC39723.1 hypothetical protein [Spirochaetota bacterium]HPL16809.1 hypothetical protein [Spirochaetota bacterium]HQF07451.1 hypothetical protein [Spirochaetota bacterium]HQH96711.1 hypothetical protein [Spirochaetota bacterium]
MLHLSDLTWLPKAALLAAMALLGFLYFIKRRTAWREIIGRAADYHRFHLAAMRNDPGVNDRSRELAYAMLMVLDRQFRDDMRGSPGLRGVVRAHLGEKSTLLSLGEIFEKLYRDRAFLGNSGTDERLVRLYLTMSSMVYRYYLMTSVACPVALLYMDLVLALAAVRLDRRGSSRLFRDMAMKRG